MTNKSEFYSIIQFHLDPFRAEGINIGVIVGEGLKIEIKINESNARILHVFGEKSIDVIRLNSSKKALKNRIFETIKTQKELEDFISKESGQLVIIKPRPCVIQGSLEDACTDFFNRLVLDG